MGRMRASGIRHFRDSKAKGKALVWWRVVEIGPGVLDVTVWRQKESLTVHLVNLTNPMMMKGPIRELIPVGEQKVRLRLPDGSRPKEVRLLAADKVLSAEQSGQYLSVVVPSI